MEESFQNLETKIVLIGNKADMKERKIEKKNGEKNFVKIINYIFLWKPQQKQVLMQIIYLMM